MDNAASRDHNPGEDLRAPPPSPEGQDEEYILRSEDDEIFNPRMRNLYYKDPMGQIQGPFHRDVMIEWLEPGLQVRVDDGLFEPVLLKDIMKYLRTETRIPHPFGPISRPNRDVQLSSRGIMPPVALDAPESARISEDVTQTTGLISSASESIEGRTSLESIPATRISEDVTQTTGLISSASESIEGRTSLEIVPATRISEDVTQTTGLISSASESIEGRTSLESVPATRISEDVTQTTGLILSASESTEVNTSLESNPDRSHETVNSVSTEAGERKEASEEMSANAALQKGKQLTEIIQEEIESREASGMGKIDKSLRGKRSFGKNHTGGKGKQQSIFASSSRRGYP